MYQITVDGKVIGLTETLVFNRLQDNGCYTECPREQAQGFVLGGKVYSMAGREGFKGVPFAAVSEFDGGAALGSLQVAVDDIVVSSLMGGTGNV